MPFIMQFCDAVVFLFAVWKQFEMLAYHRIISSSFFKKVFGESRDKGYIGLLNTQSPNPNKEIVVLKSIF